MRFAFLLLLYILPVFTCFAQQQNYTAFTVNNGLPSNHIYQCLEDDKGFLWVATDAGIARFDGKHFQVFTMQQGLPDNEVLAVVKERNGRIWVNCFKQSPAYFDEVKNRFINAKEDTLLSKATVGTSNMYCIALQNGGVIFYNEKGSFIIKNHQLISYNYLYKMNDFYVKENSDSSLITYRTILADSLKKIYSSKLFVIKNNKYIDSVTIRTSGNERIMLGINEGNFYIFSIEAKKCFVYSHLTNNIQLLKIDSLTVPENYFIASYTPVSFYLVGLSGKIYVFNKTTLQLQTIITGNYLANSFYNDSKGNNWISTIDKGLLLYKKKQLVNIEMPKGFTHTNFLSIAKKPNGPLLGGNYYGEILEINKNKVAIHILTHRKVARQRSILFSQNKCFSFSETGIYVNNKLLNSVEHNGLYYGKTAINYNDSIILVGTAFGTNKLNTISQKLTQLNILKKRTTALAKAYGAIVYLGSTDGVYKYDFKKNAIQALNKNNALLSERVSALCSTPDSLLWVATSGNGIAVVKNDTILQQISENEGIIDNACRSITSGKPGQVWLGTSKGISIINYALVNNKITVSIQNLSVHDGLTNNVINDMQYQNDTVYAATGDGISIIPANIKMSKFTIPVQLIKASINQQDTAIAPFYTLDYNQRDIQLQFAGIELGGHFKNFEYVLDKNIAWTTLDNNTLTLQLNNGSHLLQVRARDVNGNISNSILAIKFEIATPFWKAIWFWVLLAVALQIVFIYFINKRQKRKKEEKLAKEIASVHTAALEQQAFTSLMNPHFMFNALNSIQHYINVQDRQSANRYLSDFASLIRKSFEAAQQSFIPLEQELENIKIYLRLEQMRFANKFSYKIIIPQDVDVEHWMIPTMMLQPLLENAVLHGIMPSSIAGELIIQLNTADNNLIILITDNGIGLKNSAALKQNIAHKSHGMDLIKKRIEALNHLCNQPISITCNPAFDSNKNPGNTIKFSMPEALYQVWQQIQHT